jgi:hypothetical protein
MKVLLCVTLAYFVFLITFDGEEGELLGFFEGVAWCGACVSSLLLLKTGGNNVH